MKMDYSLRKLRTLLSLAAGLTLVGCGPSQNDDGADAGSDGDGSTADDIGDDPDSGDDLDGDSGTSVGDGDGDGDGDCEGDEEIILADGTASGFAKAVDGAIHRCAVREVDPTISALACAGDEVVKSCDSDADCTGAPNGRCLSYPPQFDQPDTSCGCAYSCASDDECPQDSACIPVGVDELPSAWSTCALYAGCKTDDDCASGECGLSSYYDGCFVSVSLNCRDADDLCRTDTDCAGLQCVAPGAATTWSCADINCAIGRPLTVDGKWHKAALEEGGAWLSGGGGSALEARRDGAALSAGGLAMPLPSPVVLSQVVAAWLEAAALEHASVASFSRHALELMSLGAPAFLLAQVHQAALDEIEHTTLCLREAQALDGVVRSPAPLSMVALELRTELRDFAIALVQEGCVGESLGAAEADLAARACTVEVTATVLRRIAEDEARHAALAFRTLAWVAPRLDDELRAELLEVARASLESLTRCPTSAHDDDMLTLGVLRGRELARLRRDVGRQVILPLLRAKLGASAFPSRDATEQHLHA